MRTLTLSLSEEPPPERTFRGLARQEAEVAHAKLVELSLADNISESPPQLYVGPLSHPPFQANFEMDRKYFNNAVISDEVEAKFSLVTHDQINRRVMIQRTLLKQAIYIEISQAEYSEAKSSIFKYIRGTCKLDKLDQF